MYNILLVWQCEFGGVDFYLTGMTKEKFEFYSKADNYFVDSDHTDKTQDKRMAAMTLRYARMPKAMYSTEPDRRRMYDSMAADGVPLEVLGILADKKLAGLPDLSKYEITTIISTGFLYG